MRYSQTIAKSYFLLVCSYFLLLFSFFDCSIYILPRYPILISAPFHSHSFRFWSLASYLYVLRSHNSLSIAYSIVCNHLLFSIINFSTDIPTPQFSFHLSLHPLIAPHKHLHAHCSSFIHIWLSSSSVPPMLYSNCICILPGISGRNRTKLTIWTRPCAWSL